MTRFVVSLLLIFCCTHLFAQPCTLRLTGHVHSSQAHENLPAATVSLNGATTVVTNDNGDFVFEALCAGPVTVVVSHAGYDTVVRSLAISRSQHLDIDLVPLTGVLQEVTVSGTRGLASTGLKKELSGRELEAAKGYSLAQALGRINGINILQTGSTISKPIIHGLHSNRILTINNGVRQEGQQWGAEHAPEIDPFIAARLTVIKGVDELRYGSDAIGGVILVEPRALRSTPGYNAELNTVYFSNNRQYVASAIFEQQLRRLPSLTYRLQGTFKKGANLATPGYRLNNTGLEEKNVSATAAWRKEHLSSELYYSYFTTQLGIFTGAHIGNLADLERAIATPRPDPTFTGEHSYRIGRPYQDVAHHLAKWKTGLDAGNSRFNLQVAAQYNNRKEYDVIRNAAARGAQIDLSLLTLSQDLSWEHPRVGAFSGTVGLAAMQQDNRYSGRYLIPAYQANTYGGYAIEKWSAQRWDLQAGVRFDYKEINTARLQAASATYTAYHFDFATLASSFNAGYKILPTWKANATVSLSTRAPQVNELLTNGIHHGTGTYEVGDIFLQPEQALNLSLNTNYTTANGVFSAEANLYRNRINNFIYQQPRPDEPVLTIRGAFPKIVYESTDALLQGLDLSTLVRVEKRLSLASKYSMLRARNRRLDDWLILMPADRLSNEITYSLPDSKRLTNSYLSVELQNVLQQTRVPSDKNGRQDYKAPPAGYALLNADVATTIRAGRLPLAIGLSGRNLLNTTYRDYLNFFRYFTDEMGRNISLRLKLSLEHFY